ncbi:MAG: EamA family transporter, partial [Actinomycetes bacterium]
MAALLALLSSLLWGSADFVGGTLSRRLPATVVVGASQAAGLVAITVVAALAGALGAPLGYLPWAVGAGLAGLIGLVCFYAALAAGTMGVVSPIAALGVVVPVVVGLARGERPGALQLVGITIAVAGVVLASGPELSGRAGARPVVVARVAAGGVG